MSKEIMRMSKIEVNHEALVDARLVLARYREPLSAALAEAGSASTSPPVRGSSTTTCGAEHPTT